MEIGRTRAAVLLFIFSIFSFGLIANCAKKEIKNLDSKGATIVCFGDSITYGYGVQRGQDYPSILAQMVEPPVINSGVDGDTSFSALRRIDKDVLDKNPFLVIVEFGVNDFLMGMPIEETAANVKKIITDIQARGAMVAIADPGSRIMMSGYSLEFERLSKKCAAILIPYLLNGRS